MFDERTNPTTKIEVVQSFVPKVEISSDALAKMSTYVDECSDEIGWLGTAYENSEGGDKLYYIKDVFLFDQEVHATTTEITPEGLGEFAQEILLLGDEGLEIWNNMKVWGHSHVNMGVIPSLQDDNQMETFKEGGHDWFIRLIANKKGELRVDLYDYEIGCVYLDVAWTEAVSDEENEILEQIDKLYEQIDAYNQKRKEAHEENIKEEMKLKVRKKNIGYNTKYNTNVARASFQQKKNKHTPINNQQLWDWDEEEDIYHTNSYWNSYYDIQNMFESEEEVEDYFQDTYLVELGALANLAELEEFLYEDGYYDTFSAQDLFLIKAVSQRVANKK